MRLEDRADKQQISKLEEELGAKLFNRGFSKINLTDAGDYLYTKAEQIIVSIEEAEEGLKEFVFWYQQYFSTHVR